MKGWRTDWIGMGRGGRWWCVRAKRSLTVFRRTTCAIYMPLTLYIHTYILPSPPTLPPVNSHHPLPHPQHRTPQPITSILTHTHTLAQPPGYRSAYVRWTLSISCRPNKGLFPSVRRRHLTLYRGSSYVHIQYTVIVSYFFFFISPLSVSLVFSLYSHRRSTCSLSFSLSLSIHVSERTTTSRPRRSEKC